MEFLQTYTNGRNIIVDKVIEDIGSGFNYKCKKWNQVLDEVLEGKVKTIYVVIVETTFPQQNL